LTVNTVRLRESSIGNKILGACGRWICDEKVGSAFSLLIAETCAKSQFAPLNPKSGTIPKTGIIPDSTLMLTNYPAFGTLYFLPPDIAF